LREATRIWWKIGWMSFGGPAGQIALMHRELVERRKWISEQRFLHALNYCMLIPGPEAQQLATYIGWLMHRTLGGIIAGSLFVLPGFLVLLALSWIYVRFQHVTILTGLFFGLKAAVLALVLEALLRVARRAMKQHSHYLVALASFISIFVFAVPFPWIILAAAAIGFQSRNRSQVTAREGTADETEYVIDRLHASGALAHTHPSAHRTLKLALASVALWIAPLLAVSLMLGTQHVLWREGIFFGQTALVTFGGAYAVLAYVAQQVVSQFQWLRPGEMIDGLALAETTPGPLILVLQFVGFVAGHRFAAPLNPWVGGTLGAMITVWMTFVPCFFFIFVGAPYIEMLRKNAALTSALSYVTAAVVGVIANLSLWFALHTLFARVDTFRIGVIDTAIPDVSSINWIALGLSTAACVALFRFKIPFGWVLASAAVLGILLSQI
jgi:chromate transporter